MTRLIFIVCTSLLLTQAFGQLRLRGTFIGLLPIKNYGDSVKPNYKWYHLSELRFKEDSVFLEQSPVAIYKKDTVFSASDGGFYTYHGTVQKYKGKTVAFLTLLNCDYCSSGMVRFTPPKIINDYDTTTVTVVDTSIQTDEPKEIEDPRLKYKALIIDKTVRGSIILVNRNIFKQSNK